MDVWRVASGGGAAERITQHNSRVSHPVLLDDRTLAYLATDRDGSGPWLYTLDLGRRLPRRASLGLARYTSLAASGDRRRLVASLADPKITLWRLVGGSDAPAVQIALPTGGGTSPRIGPGYLLFVSSQETGDTVWKVSEDSATELWSEQGARVIGGPGIAADGRRIVMSVQHGGATRLYTMNADGTGKRAIGDALALRGAPAWAPDGASVLSAVMVDGTPRVARIAPDGRVALLLREYSVDPVWSPDGALFVYTGPDIGTTFRISAAAPDGRPHAMADLTLTRGARRLRLLEDGRTLVALLGTIRHKDLWYIDLMTGDRRQVTHLPPDFEVREFDVSPDGRDIVVERVQEHADIVLIEVPARR
jgi:hypothetical protein